MIKAIRKRHYSIYKYFENRNLVFKTDIVYSLINISIDTNIV